MPPLELSLDSPQVKHLNLQERDIWDDETGAVSRGGWTRELDFQHREISGEPHQQAPTFAPSKEYLMEIAAFFVDALSRARYKPYLVGGGAITMHGGKRPIADLDFRIDGAKGQSFNDKEGKAILDTINKLILPRANLTFCKSKGAIQPFRAIGDDALTIGTTDWCGVEVSLSILQGFPHLAMDLIPKTDIPALCLVDLFRDKMKSVISRTKSGKDSIKKVAQDLFDVLALFEMLPRDHVSDLSKLLGHLAARSAQYKIANLEVLELPSYFGESEIALRMLDRLVMTIESHLVHGQRQAKFKELIDTYEPKLMGTAQSFREYDLVAVRPGPVSGLTAREYWAEIERILLERLKITASTLLHQMVVKQIVDYANELDLTQWFGHWNSGNFAPPRKWKPPGALMSHMPQLECSSPMSMSMSMCMSPMSMCVSPMTMGSSSLKTRAMELQTNMPKGLKNEDVVIYTLMKAGGFRELGDSKNEQQVAYAFGISKSQFSRAFGALFKAGYVKPSAEGLSLTDAGRKYAATKATEWKL
jgi:hypothetical protein